MNGLLVKVDSIKSQFGVLWQIGLLYMATYVNRNSRHKIQYYDMQIKPKFRELAKCVAANDIRVIGISCNSHERFEVYSLAKQLKRDFPYIQIVVGGPHHTMVREFPTDVPIDFFVFNDGELAFKEIVDTIECGGNYRNIQGIAYHNGSEYITNPIRSIRYDLDDISVIDWDLLEYSDKYGLKLSALPGNPEMVHFVTSRGCQFNCRFCCSPLLNYGCVRYMSPKIVVNELEKLVSRFPDRVISIYDENFLTDKERTRKIVRYIRERKLEFDWACYSRLDLLDPEVIGWIKDVGCVLISFGLESGSDKILKLMDKGIESKKQIDMIKCIKNYGIATRFFIILDYPNETVQDFENSISVIKRAGIIFNELVIIPHLRVYPNTKVFFDLQKIGYLPADFRWEEKNTKIEEWKNVPIYIGKDFERKLEILYSLRPEHWDIDNRMII